jgi:hypothetical protein
MKFKIYKEYGALNSVPVFAAVEQGLKNLGFSVVDSGQDVEIIWSVLWQGRMKNNQQVYERAIANGTPVMIVEVGNLLRGRTWRLSLNHINGLGIFANSENLDKSRINKLGINLLPENLNRREEILIAGQHQQSLQWKGQPPMADWVRQKISEIRKFSSRNIIVRPHPRSPFILNISGVKVDTPRQLPNTYDDFNFDSNYHCVVNFNSGPAVKAAISGIPVITDSSSLAYPVSDLIENIEEPILKPREEWFLKLCHTEWTVEEIATGEPIRILVNALKST